MKAVRFHISLLLNIGHLLLDLKTNIAEASYYTMYTRGVTYSQTTNIIINTDRVY